MVRFLQTGVWGPEQVQLRWVESSWRCNPQVQQIIERTWLDSKAQRPAVNLFDGPMCRLEAIRCDGGPLLLDLSRTSYRIFYGTNLMHPELREAFGDDVMARAVGVSVGLISADGYLMLGRRNSTVAYYPDRLHPFAGTLEPDDALDAFAAAKRELLEELNLPADCVASMACLGVVEDARLHQPEMVFSATASRTRQELEAGVAAAEHRATWSTRVADVDFERALHDETMLTPVARATILLVGRQALGAEWFEGHRGKPPRQ